MRVHAPSDASDRETGTSAFRPNLQNPSFAAGREKSCSASSVARRNQTAPSSPAKYPLRSQSIARSKPTRRRRRSFRPNCSRCNSGRVRPESDSYLLFEGRDAAGKGGTIKRFTEHLNPRSARVVALEKAFGCRARSVVLPTLYFAPADQRGDGAVRPVLVQPRRCRTCDGVLRCRTTIWNSCARHQSSSECSCARGSGSTNSGSRSPRAEQRRRFKARETDPLKQWKLSRQSTSHHWKCGKTTLRPRRRCSSTRTPPMRPGL